MSLLRGIWRLADRPVRRRMVLSAIGSATLALMDVVAVMLLFPLLQLVLSSDDLQSIELPFGLELRGDEVTQVATVLAVVVAALFLTKTTLSIAFLRWNLGFILDAEARLATRVFAQHLASAPAATAVLDTAAVQRTLGDAFRRVFPDGMAYALPSIADRLVITLLALGMVLIAPLEALIATSIFAGAAYFYKQLLHARTSRASKALHEDQRHALSLSRDALRASREIALSQTSGHFVNEYRALRARLRSTQCTIAFNEQLPRSFLELCLLVCTSAVTVVAFSHRSTAAAVAIVGTFTAVGFRVLPSLNRAMLAAARARSAAPSLAQLETDLRDPRDEGPGRNTTPVPASHIDLVEIRGLTVELPDHARPVVDAVHLALRRGEVVGIFGPSGAGKTTLMSAILGFVAPSAGATWIDRTHAVAGPSSWSGRAAYVPQEVVITDASLRENVAFGSSVDAIDDTRVHLALRRARLDDFVAALPNGIDTRLGEGGRHVSGGQRQRIGIARALYRETVLLVLDEVTAGLDLQTEREILDMLRTISSDRIVLLVSHHQSVMEFCDHLVVLRHGRIAGSGTIHDVRPTLERVGLMV